MAKRNRIIDQGYTKTRNVPPVVERRCIVCNAPIKKTSLGLAKICSWKCNLLQSTNTPHVSPMIYKVYGFCGVNEDGERHSDKEIRGVKLYRDDMKQRCSTCKHSNPRNDICWLHTWDIDGSMVCDDYEAAHGAQA